MTTTHPVDIGGAAVDHEDPYALTEQIQYLVRHEMPFVEFQVLLEDLMQKPHDEDWTAYEEFLELVDLHLEELDGGSVHSSATKDKVINFDRHRRGGRLG